MKKILKNISIFCGLVIVFLLFFYCISIAVDGQIKMNKEKEIDYIYKYNSYNNFKD